MDYVVCEKFNTCSDSHACGGARPHDPRSCDPCSKYKGTAKCIPVVVNTSDKVVINESEFSRLLSNIETLIKMPKNTAALVLARTSVETLRGYTPSVVAAAVEKRGKQDKLERLATLEGLTLDEMLGQASCDSVAKGICSVPRCDYTNDVEPDQAHGYCEKCGGQTVTSCLVLAGIL
jgi:hypothetical protein